MEGILNGLSDTLKKQQSSADAKRVVRDDKAAALQGLVNAQRAYYRAVKELSSEAARNEVLAEAASAAGMA